MMGIIKTLRLGALFALGIVLSGEAMGQAWNFTFGYRTVFASNALENIEAQTNIKRVNEGGGVTYWFPTKSGTVGSLTQKFTFPATTTQAFLKAELSSFNLGGGSGAGSLYGSRDGTNWVLLLNAPKPAAAGFGISYSNKLPSSLIGSTTIWIQARLKTSGMMNTAAQYLRQYTPTSGTNNIFELDVNYGPTMAGNEEQLTTSSNTRKKQAAQETRKTEDISTARTAAQATLGETWQQITNRLGNIELYSDVDYEDIGVADTVCHRFYKDGIFCAVTFWHGKSVQEMFVKTNGFTSTEIETLLENHKSTGKWVKIEEEIAKIWLPEFEKEGKTTWYWNPVGSSDANEDVVFLANCLGKELPIYQAETDKFSVMLSSDKWLETLGEAEQEKEKKKLNGF